MIVDIPRKVHSGQEGTNRQAVDCLVKIAETKGSSWTVCDLQLWSFKITLLHGMDEQMQLEVTGKSSYLVGISNRTTEEVAQSDPILAVSARFRYSVQVC